MNELSLEALVDLYEVAGVTAEIKAGSIARMYIELKGDDSNE